MDECDRQAEISHCKSPRGNQTTH